MRILSLLFFLSLVFSLSVQAQRHMPRIRTDVPLDSIVLSDPCVLADEATHMYYMTGTGGMLWKSADLKRWTGPYRVAEVDTTSWMGPRPMIWAAEIHKYQEKYYYFATFTNQRIRIDSLKGNIVPRRASHILVSDRPDGPFRPVDRQNYLPEDKATLDGTFWVDTDGHPYMVYCWEWLQNWDGTIEKIRLTDDLSGSVGEGKILFRASDSPWSCEKDEQGGVRPNKVTDGPWLFRTQTGKLGMLWTSWRYNVYTQGVAYSESGTLDGPWIQEPQPITPPNYGHGMLFRTFEGQLMLSAHHHEEVNGRYHRVPRFFPVDDSGDKLVLLDDQAEASEQKVEPGFDAYNFKIEMTDMYPRRWGSRTLSYGYSLEVRNDSVISYLPYMGVQHIADFDNDGLRFKLPLKAIKARNLKKGRREVVFTCRKGIAEYKFRVTAYPGGKADVDLMPSNADGISYMGEWM